MDIIFKNGRLQKCCNELRQAQKRWGTECGRLVIRRLSELTACENLAIVHTLPQARCHELKMDRKGQFAVDLKHPYRLIFEPANHPVPTKQDGGVDLNSVTAIKILEIVDYHD